MSFWEIVWAVMLGGLFAWFMIKVGFSIILLIIYLVLSVILWILGLVIRLLSKLFRLAERFFTYMCGVFKRD